MAIFDACYKRVTSVIAGWFRRYGEIVGKYPLAFIIIPIVVFGGLGAGLIAIDEELDLETVYFPMNSRAIKDRQFVRDTFPDTNNKSYSPFSQSDMDNSVTFIFKAKEGKSIFDPLVTSEISDIVSGTRNFSSSGNTYSDFCAKLYGTCVVDGEVALSSMFQTNVNASLISYPVWNGTQLDSFISGETVKAGKLVSATVLKISFKLANVASDWKKKFLQYAEDLDPTNVDVAYETPDSLSEELDKSTKGDIIFFSLTIALCCTYASIVTTGGNPVSTRGMLAFGGILAAGLGIVGSMGLLSACGVKFVNIVGVIPFLIIGIGVDDMFLLMSSWSESLPSNPEEQNVQHVPIILGRTLASAGIGISITSITDFLAFAIGATSVFKSVVNFSLYAGVAVLFCYLANVTLFSGCLAFHGRRVYASRHTFTCLVTKPRQELKEDGKGPCFALVCGGSPPKKERDDESVCEMFPSKVLPLLFKNSIVSAVIVMLFLGYLAAAIFGTINLKQGLILNDLVLDSSYYHKFLTLSDEYFLTKIPVGFYAKEMIDYSGQDGTMFQNLLKEARNDYAIASDFERCWLDSYKKSTYYNPGAPADFVSNLQTFLIKNPDFEGDVVLDDSNTSIMASRCFVSSTGDGDQYDNAKLMDRMRDLADASSLSVFAYHSSFVAYEQFLAVLPATLMMVGCAVAVMTVVTFIFLPHILMVLLVVLTIVMILVGIFGFMYFWNLTLSSITMIHLVMSVGFSVDFSAHVCAAFMLSESKTRQERARDAIRHAAGPILNGATSTMLGILLLLASTSFIFQSFFKVMFLVILFGLLHAVFFLPAILSLLGPENAATKSSAGKRSASRSRGGKRSAPKSSTREHSAGLATVMNMQNTAGQHFQGGNLAQDSAPRMHMPNGLNSQSSAPGTFMQNRDFTQGSAPRMYMLNADFSQKPARRIHMYDRDFIQSSAPGMYMRNREFGQESAPTMHMQDRDFAEGPAPRMDTHDRDFNQGFTPRMHMQDRDFNQGPAPRMDTRDTDFNQRSAPRMRMQDRDFSEEPAPRMDTHDRDFNQRFTPRMYMQDRDFNQGPAPRMYRQDRDFDQEPAPRMDMRDRDFNQGPAPRMYRQDRDFDQERAPRMDMRDRDFSQGFIPRMYRQDRDFDQESAPRMDMHNRDFSQGFTPRMYRQDRDFTQESAPEMLTQNRRLTNGSAPRTYMQDRDFIQDSDPRMHVQDRQFTAGDYRLSSSNRWHNDVLY